MQISVSVYKQGRWYSWWVSERFSLLFLCMSAVVLQLLGVSIWGQPVWAGHPRPAVNPCETQRGFWDICEDIVGGPGHESSLPIQPTSHSALPKPGTHAHRHKGHRLSAAPTDGTVSFTRSVHTMSYSPVLHRNGQSSQAWTAGATKGDTHMTRACA